MVTTLNPTAVALSGFR